MNTDVLKLKIFVQEEEGLRAHVAQDALDNVEPITYLLAAANGQLELLDHPGDMHPLFDMFYEEIEDIRKEFEEFTGDVIPLGDDTKTALVRHAYKLTASDILSDLRYCR